MDNLDLQEQDFEDEWQTVKRVDAARVSYDDDMPVSDEQEQEPPLERKKRVLTGTQRIIKYQLVLCAVTVILVIALKFINAGVFQTVKSWYIDQLNSQLVITDMFYGVGRQ